MTKHKLTLDFLPRVYYIIVVMKNKILILLMSCNQPLYQEEEQACCETFLKDAEGAGLSYYFYKGTDGELTIDQESHTMLLPVPDGLGATSKKTLMAFHEALKMGGWDYIIKTNVSTWLDISKIIKAVDKWEGCEDRNIYGARFIANDASKKVPFPRGHFIILSRTLVEGIVKYGSILAKVDGMPKTDDTLLCLSMLYYLHKVLKDNYRERLMEVPAVIEWSDAIQDSREWSDALSVRCKDEGSPENTPKNMRKTHKIKRSKKQEKSYRRPMNLVETKYGLMSYAVYNQVSALIEKVKKEAEEKKQETPPQSQLPPSQPVNKLEEIRKKLNKVLTVIICSYIKCFHFTFLLF